MRTHAAVVLLSLALLALGGSVGAQTPATPPYTTANKLAWSAPANAATTGQATALTYVLRIDGTAFPVNGATCSGQKAPYACTASLTAAMVSAFNGLGSHTATLTAASGTLVSPESVPFGSPGTPPDAPTTLRIIN